MVNVIEGALMKKILVSLTCVLAASSALSADAKRKISKADEAAAAAWVKTLPEANADYGPVPDQYEEITKHYFAERLKDPDSAKYSDFRPPKPSHLIVNKYEKAVQYGYVVCAFVNAKNSFGGYVGKKLAWLFIRDNAVVESALEDSTDFTEKVRMLVVLRDKHCAP
jgi:hypothetical protein